MNISIVALYYFHYIFTTFFSPLQLGLIILYVTKLILQNNDKVGLMHMNQAGARHHLENFLVVEGVPVWTR